MRWQPWSRPMLWPVSLTDPVLLVPVPTQRIVSTGYTVTSHGTYKRNTQLTAVAVSKTQNLALSEQKPLILSLLFYPEWA